MNDNIVYVLIVDSTDDGEYQNNAHAVVFKDEMSALKYMKEDIADTLTNDGENSENCENLKWYGAYEAQYRRGEIVVDWKLEKQSVG